MIATTTLGIMKKSPKYRLSVLRTHGIFANDSVKCIRSPRIEPNAANPYKDKFYSNCVFFPFDLKSPFIVDNAINDSSIDSPRQVAYT